MSYTKLDVRYTTDGANTLANVNTRQGEKHRTIALPKKVQEYGDRYGYESLEITFELDHLIIKYDGTVLMDVDINGTNNNEYISTIESYEWLPKQEVPVTTPIETEVVEEIEDDREEDVTNDDDDIIDDDEEWTECEDVDYNDINYSIAEWDDGDIDVDACILLDESMKEIVIPEEITSQETGKPHKVTTYSISDGEYKRLSLPKTIKNIYGCAFSELPNASALVLELNSPHIKMENKVIYSHRTENGKDIVELQNTQLNKPVGKFIVPNGVTSIGKEAFVGCDKLEEIELPNTLGSIYSIDWISGCDKLQRISIHNTKGAISIFNDEDELNEVECTLEETLPSNIQVVYLDDTLTDKQEPQNSESQNSQIIKLIVGLVVYGVVGFFVMEASALIWGYGLFLFWWKSFAKKGFEWQEKMWTWYMRKVATLFVESQIDKRIKLAVRLSVDILISLFIIDACLICAIYGLLLSWCEYGKRNLKCAKRIAEWYVRRVKATLKQDDTVELFSEELFTKELEE